MMLDQFLIHLLNEWANLEARVLQVLVQQRREVTDRNLLDLLLTCHDQVESNLRSLQPTLARFGLDTSKLESHSASGILADRQEAMRRMISPSMRDFVNIWTVEKLIRCEITDCLYISRIADISGNPDLAEEFDMIRISQERLASDLLLIGSSIMSRLTEIVA
jgi:ferritin-like metal-binding protein YciE